MVLTNRQKQIINASLQLIEENGIQNFTTNNLAKKLGVTEPAIYRHFKSKLEILLSTLNLFEEDSKLMFEIISIEKVSNIEKARMAFIKRCEEFSNNPQFANIIFSEEIFRNEQVLSLKVLQIMMLHQNYFNELLNKAISLDEIRKDIPQEDLCIMIMGSLRLLVTRWRLSNYSFNLCQKANSVWNSICTLLKEN